MGVLSFDLNIFFRNFSSNLTSFSCRISGFLFANNRFLSTISTFTHFSSFRCFIKLLGFLRRSLSDRFPRCYIPFSKHISSSCCSLDWFPHNTSPCVALNWFAVNRTIDKSVNRSSWRWSWGTIRWSIRSGPSHCSSWSSGRCSTGFPATMPTGILIS